MTTTEVLEFHPLAEIFPLMEGDQLTVLANSIKLHGLREPPIVFEGKVLDGRNRYRACLEAGVEPTFRPFCGDDPVAFVIDLNLHRRHLTPKQRRELIIRLIAMQPEKSDRQIAETVKVDHKTVAAARKKGEDVGRIPHVEKRKDSKGRQQPARKAAPPAQDSARSRRRLRPRQDDARGQRREAQAAIRGRRAGHCALGV